MIRDILKYTLLALALLFAGCEDERVPRDYPRVRTLEVTGITPDGALFAGEVYEPGTGKISDHGFVCGISNPGIDSDNKVYLGSFECPGRFAKEIPTTLTEGVTYKVTAFVKSGEYTVNGNVMRTGMPNFRFTLGLICGRTHEFVYQTGGYDIESPYSLTVTGSQWESLRRLRIR